MLKPRLSGLRQPRLELTLEIGVAFRVNAEAAIERIETAL